VDGKMLDACLYDSLCAVQKESGKTFASSVHILPCDFWRLMNNPKNPRLKAEAQDYMKYLKEVKILNKPYIVYPINLDGGDHWILAIVLDVKKSFDYVDDLSKSKVLLFDPSTCPPETYRDIFQKITNHFWELYRFMHPVKVLSVGNIKMRHRIIYTPKQENDCDSGIYVDHYFRTFFAQPIHFLKIVIPTSDPEHPDWEVDKAKTHRGACQQRMKTLCDEYKTQEQQSDEEGTTSRTAKRKRQRSS
jgi:Ulp1 family protease